MNGIDGNYWINFVLHAVYGKLAEADHIMRVGGMHVRSFADKLASIMPINDRKAIYRGVLLDPAIAYRADPKLMFLSWSEDPFVARWFASPDSVISTPVIERHPDYRGYLFTLEEPRSRVLFHHSWVKPDAFARFALQHPLMGVDGQRQIRWSLETQREVITEPVIGLVPIPVEPVTREIDRRLAPSWIDESEFAL